MSQENVEIVRRMIDDYLSGNVKAAFVAVDPDVAWDISLHPLPDWPNTGRGREEWQRHAIAYASGWSDYRSEVRELIDAGEEEVIVVVHETVGLRDSEAILERDLHQAFTVRNGVIVRMRVFKNKAQALEAAGLSEVGR